MFCHLKKERKLRLQTLMEQSGGRLVQFHNIGLRCTMLLVPANFMKRKSPVRAVTAVISTIQLFSPLHTA